jgi:hypothetical protein
LFRDDRQERFLLVKGRRQPFLKKGIEMKRFLALVLIAALGMFTIGCESKKGTTENKTQTTTTQTKDGKITDEATTSTDVKTKTTTPAAGGMTTERTTEWTTKETKDGKTAGEKTTSTDTKTTTPSGMTTEKTSETTTEATK